MTNPAAPGLGDELAREDKRRLNQKSGVPMQKLDHARILRSDADLLDAWERFELGSPVPPALDHALVASRLREGADVIERLTSEHSVLTEEVERLEQTCSALHSTGDELCGRIVGLEASNERMRKALEEAHKVITVVRRNIMVEVIGGNERFQGVPEILANDISNIAQALQGDQGAAQSPEGWVLVPPEITLEMQHAYFDVIDENLRRVETDAAFGRFSSQEQAYRAMIAAAPLPSPPEQGEG